METFQTNNKSSENNNQPRKHPAPKPSAPKGGSLSRGLRILEVLSDVPTPITLGEISNLCELDISSTHRLLKTLVQEGYVIRSEDTKKYILSPQGLFPLSLYHPLNALRRDAQLPLSSLRSEVQDTVGLAIFVFQERLLLDIALGRHSLSPYYDTWIKSPIHGSASGKVLLLSMPQKEREQLLGPGPYEQHTQHTVTDPAVLGREIEASRERGYVIAQDDAFVGLTALAAPVWTGETSIMGCFFVVGHSADFDKTRIDETGLALKQTATLFSQSIPNLKQVAHLFERM